MNVTPDRPSSAFFRAGSEITSKLIFDSLRSDGIPANAVRCLARKPTGETMITFKNEEYCCKFLDNSAFFIRNHGYQRGYPAHPAGGELTFVTIYDAPFEMSDAAIEERLKPYCTVFSRHRGKLQGFPDVANGLRHYRVQLMSSIPYYLQFGKFQRRFYHDGQPKICRRCGAADHVSRDCINEVCFNCDGIGHVSRSCPEKMKCCICKSEDHKAIDCPLSWYRRSASHRDAPPDESGPGPGADADPSQFSEAAASFANDAEVDSDDNAANDAEVNAGSSPVASEHHLVNSQGLLNPPPPPADLPVHPPTVMQSSQDFSLLTDLTLSGSEDYLDGDEAGDAIDEELDDEEFVDADDVDSVDNHDSFSQELDSIAAQEAIP